jgi:hypothetical protein
LRKREPGSPGKSGELFIAAGKREEGLSPIHDLGTSPLKKQRIGWEDKRDKAGRQKGRKPT